MRELYVALAAYAAADDITEKVRRHAPRYDICASLYRRACSRFRCLTRKSRLFADDARRRAMPRERAVTRCRYAGSRRYDETMPCTRRCEGAPRLAMVFP